MSTPPPFDVRRATDVANEAARRAAAAALRHWRRLDRVDTKSDGSPVTVADREAEAAAVDVIQKAFPDHGVLGEEGGERPGRGESTRTRWIIDPLDGTIGYSRGGLMWGPLVALEHEGEVVAGAMHLPALRTAYWAGRGLGCLRDGERVRVSSTAAWRDAIVSLGGVHRLLFDHPESDGVATLVRSCRTTRAYGDVAACAMLLDGVADAWIEAGVQLWDLAAARVLVEEAGGRFTDFSGRPTHARGECVATNGPLHAHVLEGLAKGRALRP